MRRALRHLLLLLTLLTVVCAFAVDDQDEPAPRFRAKTLTGETFNNESVKGKVVLLEFWTTWCKYCEEEEPLVEQINKEFSSKGLIVLAVDVAESKKTVKKYLDQHPRSTRIVLTEDTNLAAMYQANSYPIYVVIDRGGNIAGEQRGAARREKKRSADYWPTPASNPRTRTLAVTDHRHAFHRGIHRGIFAQKF